MTDDTFVIGPRAGYAHDVGVLVSMLQNARRYLKTAVRDLDVAALDARPGGGAVNTIGSILAHVDAAENMFQRITFEDRGFNDEEGARYGPAFQYEGAGAPRGRELVSYTAALDETRERTLVGMRERDRAWLDTAKTFRGRPSNIHYYWLHFLEDEARHTGQIILIRKHLAPGATPDWDPYGLRAPG